MASKRSLTFIEPFIEQCSDIAALRKPSKSHARYSKEHRSGNRVARKKLLGVVRKYQFETDHFAAGR
jgi:hypothetical protein